MRLRVSRADLPCSWTAYGLTSWGVYSSLCRSGITICTLSTVLSIHANADNTLCLFVFLAFSERFPDRLRCRVDEYEGMDPLSNALLFMAALYQIRQVLISNFVNPLHWSGNGVAMGFPRDFEVYNAL